MVAPADRSSFALSPPLEESLLLDELIEPFIDEEESSFQSYLSSRASIILSEKTTLAAGKIVNVFQSEIGITCFSDKKPLIGTFGCGSCVALGGYEEANKIAFVAHISTVEEACLIPNLLFPSLLEMAKKKIQDPIKLYLRGGAINSCYQSCAILEEIKGWTKEASLPMMQIISEEQPLPFDPACESLLIDSRTGAVESYFPEDYALYMDKPFTDEEMARIVTSCTSPEFRIVYSPKPNDPSNNHTDLFLA